MNKAMTHYPDEPLKQQFFEGMSHAACTVNVVTTDGPAGRAGVTVSAMSSVSADTPRPSLLVCVHHMSPAADAILENRVFCVNVLRDDQSYISDTFAGRIKTAANDKFSCAEWMSGRTGAPRVKNPLVAFDCTLMHCEQVGTHWVLFGAVEEVHIARRGSPLIYANRAYGTSKPIEPAAATAPQGEARELRAGCFRTFAPYLIPELVGRLVRDHPSTSLLLRDGSQRQIVEGLHSGDTEIALLYDFDLGPGLVTEQLTEIQPYVLLPRGHPLASRPRIELETLRDEPLILLDAPPSRDYFLSVFEARGVTPRIGHRAGSFEVVRGLVGHGLGYSLLATKPASDMSYDGRGLATVDLDCRVPGSRIVLTRKEGAPLSPVAGAFARHCREFFAPTHSADEE